MGMRAEIDWKQWVESAPCFHVSDLTIALHQLQQWYNIGANLLNELPTPEERTPIQIQQSFQYRNLLAAIRGQFVAVHGIELYAKITNNWHEFVRVDELTYRIADFCNALAPTKEEVNKDALYFLSNKQGHELSQGFIISELLAIPSVGKHIMAAMRLPKPTSFNYVTELQNKGEIDLGTIKIHKKDNVGYVILSNLNYLNAEDDALNAAMESAVDITLLDPDIEIGIIRGDIMVHKKYKGMRVFCSGINLTHLYEGKLSYLFYVTRELGLISKIYRGLLTSNCSYNESPDEGLEKPWISVVDSHAIGGGCQMMLVSDYVIAEKKAYFTIPARTEGFIPGLANLRLPRYTGQKLANRMIYHNYKVFADSKQGKLLVDEVVETPCIPDSIERITKEMCKTGIQGMISNRKAFRHGNEPLDLFRNYMATFCKEQAKCMYDEEIIKNLESFWF